METTKIFEGKTSTEAIEKGLKELKASKKDVDIRILEDEDKKSFFSILAPRVVKVEMTLKEKKTGEVQAVLKSKEISKENIEKAQEQIEKFLKEFIKNMGKEIDYQIKQQDGNTIYVEIEGEEAKFLIGYRGETLNALQTILIAIAGKKITEKIHVNVDILGYREKRKKVLEDLAQRVANGVIKNRKSVTLEPMTAYERKIIHTKLQDNEKVKTESIGEGEHRRIVVSLK